MTTARKAYGSQVHADWLLQALPSLHVSPSWVKKYLFGPTGMTGSDPPF